MYIYIYIYIYIGKVVAYINIYYIYRESCRGFCLAVRTSLNGRQQKYRYRTLFKLETLS